jgi:hypothetical protein
MDRKTRRARQIYSAINDILFKDWDPIGMNVSASRIGPNGLDGFVTITATKPTNAFSSNRNPRRQKKFISANASVTLSPSPSIQSNIRCTRAAQQISKSVGV